MQTASEYLLAQAGLIAPNKPLVMPQYPPNSGHIQPGQIKMGDSELKPNCMGLVIAIACNADDAQSLVDALTAWQKQRLEQQ